MATLVPASLKPADITRFAMRAGQLEQAKPVITYWCWYWIVQQIIQRGLHSADEEALAYTTGMMEKLEKFKNEHVTDDTVTDDVAGKAYVEQFGLETFSRADKAVQANRASRQTADTYQASATFLELLHIWGPLEPDIQQKIRYAKFHALRIAKALKAGEDPNLSNPQPEPAPLDVAPPLDPNDPEVQLLNGTSSRDRQPSVAEVPDETDLVQARLAAQSSLNESIHPSRAPSVPPGGGGETRAAPSSHEFYGQHATGTAVSPLPTDTAAAAAAAFYGTGQPGGSPVSPDRQSSVGGNYFPRMPSPGTNQIQPGRSPPPPTLPSAPHTLVDDDNDDDAEPRLPSAPTDFTTNSAGSRPPSASTAFVTGSTDPGLPSTPTTFTPPQPAAPKTPLDSFQAPPNPGMIPPNLPKASTPSSTTHYPPPAHNPLPPPNIPRQVPSVLPVPITPSPAVYAPAPPTVSYSNTIVDEEAIMKAQKHARWAISALNFEDVPTAIRELQQALQTLGGR